MLLTKSTIRYGQKSRRCVHQLLDITGSGRNDNVEAQNAVTILFREGLFCFENERICRRHHAISDVGWQRLIGDCQVRPSARRCGPLGCSLWTCFSASALLRPARWSSSRSNVGCRY